MKLRGKVYHADFNHNGRRICKRLSESLPRAKTLMTQLRAQVEFGEFDLKSQDYPWQDLRDEYVRYVRQTVKRPKEYERDIEKLESFTTIKTVGQVTPALVHLFRDHRIKEGVTPRTINRQVGTIRAMLNRGVEWGRIAENPIASVKQLKHPQKTKKRRALDVVEFKALFEKSPPHLSRVWRMLAETGMRREEVVALKFEDVDIEAGTVTILAENAKSGRQRIVPLSPAMCKEIATLAATAAHRQPATGGAKAETLRLRRNFSRQHVFVTPRNTTLVNNLLREFYRCCKVAGIEDGQPGGSVDIHAIRGSFVTHAIGAGASPKDVQTIVGHASLSMTMDVYAKSQDSGKRKAVEAVNRLFNGKK